MKCLLSHFDGKRLMEAVSICGKTHKVYSATNPRKDYTVEETEITCEDCLNHDGLGIYLLRATNL